VLENTNTEDVTKKTEITIPWNLMYHG